MPAKKVPIAVTSVPGNKQALLRVARAAPKDVGRGLARLNRADMEHLGVTVGDMVTVTCRERATVLKVMSLAGAKGGQRQIQMDGVARENAGARLDDRVAVELAEVADAQAVTLTTIGAALPPHARDGGHVGPLIAGLAVRVGERVSVSMFGSRGQNYNVATTDPVGFVVITQATRIQIKTARGRAASGPDAAKVAYQDIGGLGQTVARIREMIEMPMRHPEVFERLGVEAPRGVLLYGAARMRQDHAAPGPSPTRPKRTSSPSAAPRSSTSSTETARPIYELSSPKPRRRRPASSSSTRSTRSPPAAPTSKARSRSASSPSSSR